MAEVSQAVVHTAIATALTAALTMVVLRWGVGMPLLVSALFVPWITAIGFAAVVVLHVHLALPVTYSAAVLAGVLGVLAIGYEMLRMDGEPTV